MDRYENSELGSLSRTKRNQDIYNSTDMSELSRIKTNTNVSVISDAPKEIDIEKIKKIYKFSKWRTRRKKKENIFRFTARRGKNC